MRNEEVENRKMEDVYNKEYLPSIVRIRWFVLSTSTLFFLAPFLYTQTGWGAIPDWLATVKGTFAWLLTNLPRQISGSMAHFPVQGVTGMLLCSLAGSASNIRIPYAIIARKAVEVDPGTQKGSLISTTIISVTCFVNIDILVVAVFTGQAALSRFPAFASNGLSLLLPTLFKCIFVQLLPGNKKSGAFSTLTALGVPPLYKKGFLSATPTGGGSVIVILIPILGTIAFIYVAAKKKGREPII